MGDAFKKPCKFHQGQGFAGRTFRGRNHQGIIDWGNSTGGFTDEISGTPKNVLLSTKNSKTLTFVKFLFDIPSNELILKYFLNIF